VVGSTGNDKRSFFLGRDHIGIKQNVRTVRIFIHPSVCPSSVSSQLSTSIFHPDLFSKMASPPNYEEVNSYFRQRMEESRKIWSTRGRDGQIAAAAARKGTWRQLSGVPLMMHEIKHVGNRPFAWGFA